MKDVSATLRRIDEEINATRQEIARRQIDLVRLEDARRVIMGMAEADQAAGAHRAGPQLLEPGSHARPQLIVRPTGSGVGRGKWKRTPKPGTRKAAWTKEIMAAVADGSAVTSAKMGERLGLPLGAARHPLRELLKELVGDGVLVREGTVRSYNYSLARKEQAA